MWRAGLLAACCATMLCGPVGAQMADGAKFKEFLASAVHKGLVSRALAALPPTVFQQCPTLKSPGSQTTVMQPISFAPDGVPNAGAWREVFPVSGCGNGTQLNFYFAAGRDGKINTTIEIPGTTRADPLLQRDAQRFANLGAGVAAKDCRKFETKNSRFEAFGLRNPPTPDPGPNTRLRPWWETWTLIGCGRTFDVPISFVPDQTGTQIIQSARDVVER